MTQAAKKKKRNSMGQSLKLVLFLDKEEAPEGIPMECCQFKRLHPEWDGRLVSMEMGGRGGVGWGAQREEV